MSQINQSLTPSASVQTPPAGYLAMFFSSESGYSVGFKDDQGDYIAPTASFSVTSASFADNALSASYFSGSVTGNITGTASYALIASESIYALTASYLSGSVEVPTGSFATTGSNQFSGSQVITGSLEIISGSITGSLEGTASYALFASESVYALTSSYSNGFTIDGNVTVTGTASIKYLDVQYQSSSIIYSSGSNQLGDAADDTQTLYGSVIIPTGSLTVSGSTKISGSLVATTITATDAFIGTISGSISSAETASSVTTLNQDVLISGSLTVVSGSIYGDLIGTASYAQTASYVATASYALNASESVYALTSSYIATASYALEASQSLFALTASYLSGSITIETGSFATTGSNNFSGSQVITGSLNVTNSITGSNLRIENNTHLDGQLRVTNDARFDGDIEIVSATPNLKLRDTSGGGFSSGYDLRVDTGSFEIYDDTHNRDVLSDFFNPTSLKHTTSLTSEIIIISGSDSVTILGPLQASNVNLTGSFEGTASYSSFALTASYISGSVSFDSSSCATTSSNQFSGSQVITGSLIMVDGAVTGSLCGTASYALAASQSTYALTASYISGSVTFDSSSFATTGSNQFSGSQTITGSLIIGTWRLIESGSNLAVEKFDGASWVQAGYFEI